jgi:hypothetical protein
VERGRGTLLTTQRSGRLGSVDPHSPSRQEDRRVSAGKKCRSEPAIAPPRMRSGCVLVWDFLIEEVTPFGGAVSRVTGCILIAWSVASPRVRFQESRRFGHLRIMYYHVRTALGRRLCVRTIAVRQPRQLHHQRTGVIHPRHGDSLENAVMKQAVCSWISACC